MQVHVLLRLLHPKACLKKTLRSCCSAALMHFTKGTSPKQLICTRW